MTGDMVIGFVAGFVLAPPIILGVLFVIDWLRPKDHAEDYYEKITTVGGIDREPLDYWQNRKGDK